jgi:hypothetical protein
LTIIKFICNTLSCLADPVKIKMAQKKYALDPSRTQKVRKTPSGLWLYCSFSAHPEEIDKWKKLAGGMDRSLSWWIRDALNKVSNGVLETETESVPKEA